MEEHMNEPKLNQGWSDPLVSMRCRNCGQEWVVPKEMLSYQQHCPFCAIPIRERRKQTSAEQLSLGQALYGALEPLGGALLEDTDALAERMLRLSPASKREIRVFTRTVCDAYPAELRDALFAEASGQAADALGAIAQALRTEEGLSEEWTRLFTDAIQEASALRSADGTVLVGADTAPFTYTPKSSYRYENDMLLQGDTLVRCVGSYNKYEIPQGIRTIGPHAFAMNPILESVTFPDTLEQIGEGAFRSCTDLKRITIPASVREIGAGAFAGCSTLKAAQIDAEIREIPDGMFVGCASLQEVRLPLRVSRIGAEAFSECKALKGVILPRTVTKIGESAFSCSGLEQIHLLRSVRSVGAGAFDTCQSLRVAVMEGGLQEISEDMFSRCNALQVVEFSEQLKVIRKGAFSWCEALREAFLPMTLESIEAGGFKGSGLSKAYLPKTTQVAEDAFPRNAKVFYRVS